MPPVVLLELASSSARPAAALRDEALQRVVELRAGCGGRLRGRPGPRRRGGVPARLEAGRPEPGLEMENPGIVNWKE